MTVAGLRDVHKKYYVGKNTVHALCGIDLDVLRGEFLCLCGTSGSGKTTLLNLIGAIDTPSHGRVYLGDHATDSLTDRQLSRLRSKKIGFVFQGFNLIPVLTAFENVEYPLFLSDTSKTNRCALVNSILQEVGIDGFSHHTPEELSGGQKQRVAIARALVGSPELVLADEPTSQVDSRTGLEILRLMAQLNKNRNCTFIVATHDPKVLQFATRTLFLEDGRIVREVK